MLGVDPNFPIIESLTLLTAIAARTTKIKLGTGILVLPMRNPVIARQATRRAWTCSPSGRLLMGMASGWYKREFDAVGVPFEKRGKIMDENLEIMTRLWTEDMVKGECTVPQDPGRRDVSEAGAEAAPADPDRRLCRPRPQARRRQRRRLAHLFLPPGETSRNRGPRFAISPRKPARTPTPCSMPRNCRSASANRARQSKATMMDWLGKEWDYASWSESTKDSAIIGTVDECVAQLKEHLAAGVQKIIFVPYKYETEQIEIIAKEIIPRLKG